MSNRSTSGESSKNTQRRRRGWKTAKAQREYQREWKRRRRFEWIAANGPCAWCGSWGMGPLFNYAGLQIDHIDFGVA